MNEQMKQLMGQTLDEKFSGTWSKMDLLDLQKFAERFAELIVRECAQVAEEVDGDSRARKCVLEHFGVEE
jgi:hypothetical protein